MRIIIVISALYIFFPLIEQQGVHESLIHPDGNTIRERFLPPEGYQREFLSEDSFGDYLRNLPLKKSGSKVHYFDGRIKSIQNIYCAVVDMEISQRDLQQCADAVMRLRGEYLYWGNNYDKIHFNFLSDGEPRYFKDYSQGDLSYEKFLKYMDYIFAYANTASLYDELLIVDDYQEMEVGDVLIQKGRPYGHAVIIVDMCKNQNGEKLYLLAQSYMPAQETQILINPEQPDLSPWYKLKEGKIETPEWQFSTQDLKRFKD